MSEEYKRPECNCVACVVESLNTDRWLSEQVQVIGTVAQLQWVGTVRDAESRMFGLVMLMLSPPSLLKHGATTHYIPEPERMVH